MESRHREKKSIGENGEFKINLHVYVQLIFDKGVKEIQWRKDSFWKMSYHDWIYTYKRINFNHINIEIR